MKQACFIEQPDGYGPLALLCAVSLHLFTQDLGACMSVSPKANLRQSCVCSKSDIAWVISTSADDKLQNGTASGDAKKGAAFAWLRNDSSAALLTAASLQSADSLQSAGSLPSTSALESPSRAQLLPGFAGSLSPLQRAS